MAANDYAASAELVARKLLAAILDRCTCEAGPHDLTEPHDPDCSLQNTGYLT
jgi:hypothetical protein